MPEGPELRITTDFLKKNLLNEKITLKILGGRYSRHPMKNLKQIHFPLKVSGIFVKGKFIYFTFFDTEITMWVTLGMSGHFLITNDESNRYFTKKHNNIALITPNKTVFFHDYRNFGTFMFGLTKEEIEKKLSKIGMDLLDLNVKFEDFKEILLKKRSDKLISEVLLEQRYFSGIGNYCRSDSLYLAKINPFIKVKNLSETELKTLFYWIRVVLFYHYDVNYGLKHKIIHKKDLKYLPEKEGGDGKSFNRQFVVYAQETDPYGNKVIRTKDKANRTIHWVKTVQE
jgi:endonuclease-8